MIVEAIADVLGLFTSLITWVFGTALNLVFDFIIANPIVMVPLFMAWVIAMVSGVALSFFSPGR